MSPLFEVMQKRHNVLRKFLFICLPMFFLLPVANSQQIPLYGRVSILNSKYNNGTIEFVKDAFVTSEGTKSTNTDDSGYFHLEFVGLPKGTQLQIQVEKFGFEVVNSKDLAHTVLGQTGALIVHLCPLGQLDKVRSEFYNINMKALDAFYDSVVTNLYSSLENSRKMISELETRLNLVISDRETAKKILIGHIENLKKQLPEIANELAVQNLDFASKLYIEAYEHLRKGQIEKTLALLDDARLEHEEEKASQNIKLGQRSISDGQNLQLSALSQFDQIVENRLLKAKGHVLLGEYENATMQFEEMFAEFRLFRPFRGTDAQQYLVNKARETQLNHNYEKSIEYYKKAVEHLQNEYEKSDLAMVYNEMARVHYDQANYTQAIKDYKCAASISKTIITPAYYGFLGQAQMAAKKYRRAKRTFYTCEASFPENVISKINWINFYTVTGKMSKVWANLDVTF